MDEIVIIKVNDVVYINVPMCAEIFKSHMQIMKKTKTQHEILFLPLTATLQRNGCNFRLVINRLLVLAQELLFLVTNSMSSLQFNFDFKF